jgi:hypothetical protein
MRVLPLVILALLWSLAPAHAASSPGADPESAVTVRALPFDTTIDIADGAQGPMQATTCADNVSHAVWYELVGIEGDVGAHTVGSHADTVLALFAGDPGQLEEIACSDDVIDGAESRIAFRLEDHRRYFLLLGSADGAAGKARLRIVRPNASVRTELQIHSLVPVEVKDGRAAVKFTTDCSEPATWVLSGEAFQETPTKAAGTYRASLVCDGYTTHTVAVHHNHGDFTVGKGYLTITANVHTFRSGHGVNGDWSLTFVPPPLDNLG